MRILPFLVLGLLVLAACGSDSDNGAGASTDNPPRVISYWRPISEPNVEMPLDKLQRKLTFDLGQCQCGIYPENMTHSDAVEFQTDKQRLAETSVTVTPNKKGSCRTQPSLVVTECMRGRGWEPTNCSGRMPLPNGGSLCASATTD
jgi:hypothetical protein